MNRQWRHSRARRAIVSFGIVCIHTDTSKPVKERKVLLYQRRDNFEYMDFVRGLWRNEDHVIELFNLMSVDERNRVIHFSFDELWDDLWVDHKSAVYHRGKDRAKRKFEMIKDKLVAIVDLTNSQTMEPPWGYPKGKKNYNSEPSIECALREFEEETTITRDQIKVRRNHPFVEVFTGSNGKKYITKYFVATCESCVDPKPRNIGKRIRPYSVSEEASRVKWFDADVAKVYLNSRRSEILDLVLDHLEEEGL